MNYLAHMFLAERAPEAAAGALLGDFVKGEIGAADYPAAMRDEMIIHRHVDSFTDTDELLHDCKKRFLNTRRLFAGIVLDVAFDHFLAKNWADYSTESLDDFARFAYRSLESNISRFPAGFQASLPRMIAHDFLAGYRNFGNIEAVLQRISLRMREGTNLQKSFGELETNYDYFENGFRDFFPRLQKFVAEKRKNLTADSGW